MRLGGLLLGIIWSRLISYFLGSGALTSGVLTLSVIFFMLVLGANEGV